uniref:Uncharacterized protein n=1 Tax=Siphoviridae sp. ct9lR64 TaxID=2826178 RepID=A0A8S5QYD5_9CAUD|nr:MAG TPA: hypothetical protein [Siphoviridae sp. ct9lR64]
MSLILNVVKDWEWLRDILARSKSTQIKDEDLTVEDKMRICDLLWEYRNDRCSICELMKKEVE